MTVESPLLNRIPRIRHGFGTREDPQAGQPAGGPWLEQVHSAEVLRATTAHQRMADGFWETTPGIPLSIRTADCVPILLAEVHGRACAALHAGWRGTLAGIGTVLAQCLRQAGKDPAGWHAAIGPSIRPCCYVVGLERMALFRQHFGSAQLPAPDRLDLAALNAFSLQRAGFGAVEILPYCTGCSDQPAFFSYRRQDLTARQWSWILRTD